MWNVIKKYIYCVWLGGSLGYADITISNYKYWVIVVPTIIFVSIFTYKDNHVEA